MNNKEDFKIKREVTKPKLSACLHVSGRSTHCSTISASPQYKLYSLLLFLLLPWGCLQNPNKQKQIFYQFNYKETKHAAWWEIIFA